MAKSTLLHGRCCEGFVVLSRGRTWWLEGCRCVRDGLQIRGGFTPATFMVANGAHEYGLHWFWSTMVLLFLWLQRWCLMVMQICILIFVAHVAGSVVAMAAQSRGRRVEEHTTSAW